MQKAELALLATLILFATACKKDLASEQVIKQRNVDPVKVFKLPETPEEKLLVENLGKVTEVLKELYKDKANLKLVNAAVYSKTYTDESVFLKDLVYPDKSRLPVSLKFLGYTQKWNVSLEQFAKSFWGEVNKRNDPDFLYFLSKLSNGHSLAQTPGSQNSPNSQNGEGDGVTVYFPYSDQFLPDGGGGYYEPITSIATATADADEGWGNQPYFINGVFQFYTQILVNDDYVFANPTQIIGVNGIEPDPTPLLPPPPPPPPPGVSRVYLGEGICKSQYDRLISFTGNGGGSEIKYCHLTAYLQPVNGHVTTFQDIASVNFSRGDIRNKRWLRNFIVWDDDWVPADLEQVFGIYEEDNTNTKTFNGSISTTVTVVPGSTITGTIGFTVSVTSQDEIIRQLKISRKSYFAGSFQNQGQDFSPDGTFLPLPFTHGWPAYDVHYWNKSGASVGWTWPYNTF
jgi:hypothetical protein